MQGPRAEGRDVSPSSHEEVHGRGLTDCCEEVASCRGNLGLHCTTRAPHPRLCMQSFVMPSVGRGAPNSMHVHTARRRWSALLNCAGPHSLASIPTRPRTENAASNHHQRCSTISIGKEEPHWLHPFVTPSCVFPTPLAPPASTFSCRGILASWVESSRLSGSWSHRGHSTQARDSSTHCNFRARYCHSRILLRSKASSRVK